MSSRGCWWTNWCWTQTKQNSSLLGMNNREANISNCFQLSLLGMKLTQQIWSESRTYFWWKRHLPLWYICGLQVIFKNHIRYLWYIRRHLEFGSAKLCSPLPWLLQFTFSLFATSLPSPFIGLWLGNHSISVLRLNTNAGERAFCSFIPAQWNNYQSLTWPPPPIVTKTLDGDMNCFMEFALGHWLGCHATEPGLAGDIGAIEIKLTDWLIILTLP